MNIKNIIKKSIKMYLFESLDSRNELNSKQDIDKQYYGEINTDKGKWLIYTPYNILQWIVLGKSTEWVSDIDAFWFNIYFITEHRVYYIFVNQNTNEKYQIEIEKDGKQNFSDKSDLISRSEFEKETGINPDNYKWFDFTKKYPNLIVYNEKGKIKGKYINGKKEGDWITYYSDGKKKSEKYYKNGELDGKQFDYYRNGQKSYEAEYRNGKKISEYYYDENGNVYNSIINGKKEGRWIIYYNNGIMWQEQNYKNGKLDGKYIIHNMLDNSVNVKYYKNGKLIKKET